MTVRFYRAVRREREGAEWVWPDDGDVADLLLKRFDAGEKTVREWPVTTWWSKPYLVEALERESPRQFGVGVVRNDSLPLVLKAGARTGTPLPLDDRDSLLEPSYLTFFGDQVVGLVAHEHTAGHRTCAAVLAKLTNVDLDLVPIPRPDILQEIQQGTGVTSLDMTIAAGSIDVAAEQDDVVKAAEELRSGTPGVHQVTVTLKAETQQEKRQLRTRALGLLRGRGLGGLEAAHARVLTEEAGSQLINLFESDITHTSLIETLARTRHLLPEEAQAAAVQAFAAKQFSITRSIALALEADDS